MAISRGDLVRCLKAAPSRSLKVKELRAKLSATKEAIQEALAKLEAKGRVAINGKVVTLQRKSERQEESAVEETAPKKKRKTENDLAESNKIEEATPSRFETSSQGTRVFLGNLSFKIDDYKLKSAVPGITHIKWITDKETHKVVVGANVMEA